MQGVTPAQVDQFEAEIESLVGIAGKKKKGKTEADARSEECQVSSQHRMNLSHTFFLFIMNCFFLPLLHLPPLQVWVEKHRDHIQKLETLLRMLDNDQVLHCRARGAGDLAWLL